MRLVGVIVLVAGCSFRSPSGSTGDGDGVDAAVVTDAADGDASPGAPFVPLHVPAGGRAGGTGDLDLDAANVIDTGTLAISGVSPLPAGVVFDMWQQPGGGELAVLHVRGLRVRSGTVRVRGSRPLVVVASDTIDIDGVLDGSAQRDQPGPGGSAPGMGAGAGRAGTHVGTYRDAGGSGGGFAGGGGNGGSAGGASCLLQGPSGGSSYGDPMLPVLVAGSGGGAVYTWGSSCGIRPPGAGGGAIQLSAAGRVRVSGGVNVGGGGGGGGRAQQQGDGACDISAGAGGGSGGSIVLQSPIIEVTGTLAANGGGGGSSGGDSDGNDQPPEDDGKDGQNGLLAATAAAGGADVGEWSSAGGAGGTTGAGAPGQGDNNCESNGGGGGGAAGRNVRALPAGRTASGGTSSPPSVQITY